MDKKTQQINDINSFINNISAVKEFRLIEAEMVLKKYPNNIYTGTIGNGMGEYVFYTERENGICPIDCLYFLQRDQHKILSLKTIGEWYKI